MLHLLQLEWKKFHKNRVFRILAILYLMVLPSIYILAKAIPKPKIAEQEMQSFFMFPNVWKYIGFSGNWAVFFLFGFGVILSITLEYHYKTIRQNIITGLSRQSYFMAKVIWIFALAVAATLYYILVCGIIGFIETDTIFWSKVTQEIAYIPRYFLMSFGFMSVAMLFGLLLRKTGLALILYLMYNIVLEPLLRYGVHMRYFKNKSMHFYPMNAMEDLVPVPFAEIVEDFMRENKFTFLLEPQEAVITSSIYIVLILAGCYGLLKKRI